MNGVFGRAIRYSLSPALMIAMILAIASCGGSGFQTIENEQTGVTVYRLSGVYADLNRRIGGTYGQVDFGAERRVETRPDDTSFALFAAPLVLGGLNVIKGDELELVIDSDTVSLACTRVIQTKRGVEMGNPLTGRGSYYLETLRYEVDRELLRRLALASEVTYLIHGRDKDLPGELTPDNLKRYRAFYKKYVF